MRHAITMEIHPKLLDKPFKVELFLEVELGEIAASGITEKHFSEFKAEFYRVYELEYGKERKEDIDAEFAKHLDILDSRLQKELERERERLDRLKKTVSPDTLEYLKKVKEIREKMDSITGQSFY